MKKKKTLQVDEKIHEELVKYCETNQLKIGAFVDKILKDKLDGKLFDVSNLVRKKHDLQLVG